MQPEILLHSQISQSEPDKIVRRLEFYDIMVFVHLKRTDAGTEFYFVGKVARRALLGGDDSLYAETFQYGFVQFVYSACVEALHPHFLQQRDSAHARPEVLADGHYHHIYIAQRKH